MSTILMSHHRIPVLQLEERANLQVEPNRDKLDLQTCDNILVDEAGVVHETDVQGLVQQGPLRPVVELAVHEHRNFGVDICVDLEINYTDFIRKFRQTIHNSCTIFPHGRGETNNTRRTDMLFLVHK